MMGIVDLPRVFMRASAVPWYIDWGGKSAGSDNGGGDQIVMDGFPRFKGTVQIVLAPPMVLAFRAILTRLQGRANFLRVPLVDPLAVYTSPGAWQLAFRAWQNGSYIEARPKVRVRVAAAAGATEIAVDERPLRQPVPMGAIMSYADWPFVVVGRSGLGETTVLTVERLRVALTVDAEIDIEARGLFRLDDATAGNPDYGLTRVARPVLPLTEWITR